METISIFEFTKIAARVEWSELIAKAVLNLSALFIIVHTIRSRQVQRNDFIFILLIINILVFLVSFIVTSGQISAIFAFGSFIVFTTQRYSYIEADFMEIVYISVGIFAGYINGVHSTGLNLLHAAIVDILVISFVFILESIRNNNNNSSKHGLAP